MKWTLITATLLLCACQPPQPLVLPEHEVISCGDYATSMTSNGVLTNNVWNKHAAGDSVNQQCIVKRSVDQFTEFGWSWNWPKTPRAVFAQPQIKVGASPWDPEPRFGDDFPLKVSELSSLKLAHELDITSNGDFNVATTMWLTRDARSVKESIAAEMMIWTYYTKGQFNPAGKKIETVTLDGLQWELWEQADWQDASGVNQNKWQHLAFRLVQPSLKVEFDVNILIRHALKRKIVDEHWYIADLELGTELMGGEGLAWIKAFELIIKQSVSNRG